MMLEFSVFVLVLLLTVVLAVYNQRQAAALNGVRSLVQDFVAMQIRDRRNAHADDLSSRIDPLEWLARQASAGLEAPLTITETARVVPEIQAAEFHTADGKRVVVSTRSQAEILRFDSRLRYNGQGKSASARVEAFAARPLLGNRRGLIVIERVMSELDEFFDLEAAAVGERLGLPWHNPARLWFYVFK
jgi:hypothetical protein